MGFLIKKAWNWVCYEFIITLHAKIFITNEYNELLFIKMIINTFLLIFSTNLGSPLNLNLFNSKK